MAKKKLTKKIIDDVTREIENGTPYKYAAQLAGIAESTLYKYLKIAEEYQGFDEKDIPTNIAIYVEFMEGIKEAKAKSVSKAISLINKASINSWQAAAWMLERRCPDDFARSEKHQLQHSGSIDGTLTVVAKTIQGMTTEEKIEHANKLRSKMAILDAGTVGDDEPEG